MADRKSYSGDREFLSRYLSLTELRRGGTSLILAPSLQGRVMTSTTGGEEDHSFGWINYGLIRSDATVAHCNNYGGEDRFWLGPEGGQFSLFFPKGTDFSFAQWQTPSIIDTESWEQTVATETSASLRKEAALENTSGTRLEMLLEREVTLLGDAETASLLGAALPAGAQCVAFNSENKITNTGTQAWNETTGMPSIWMLGQFIPSEDNTIIIPFKEAPGEAINDAYFGKIPADRLAAKGGKLYFKGDGKQRGKIGVPPAMVVPVCGAIDRVNGTMTVVKFSFDPSKTQYVNSMWEYQAEPLRGDVINSYNDGPLEDGSIMGPFYELETSSPAAALRPGESLAHTHTTIHIAAPVAGLEKLAEALFG